MHNTSKQRLPRAQGECEAFMLPPHGWVPNNRTLPVLFYRGALHGRSEDLAEGFEERFGRNGWPVQWRDSIFDYHHFHSGAHEVLGVVSGSAEVIVGGPGGRFVHLAPGDAILLPAGTGHCLQSSGGPFQVAAGYPQGQQWDIRREALKPQELAAMQALPYPASDPVHGATGPLIDYWLRAA
ncbi:MAG TPA: cupin domain-containing protein [Paraburkholderia sp.]|nr:cupin domain-containing protein [Paraburkholderia sp.]